MEIEISLSSIKKSITFALHRYHVILFVVIILGGLIVVVLLLNNIIVKSGQSGSYTPTNSSTFDQDTINRIENLKTSDEKSDPIDLSSGRTNPFVEN